MTIGAVDAGMTAPATSLVRHKFIFCIITLFVLGLLLWLHTQFASILGEPSAPVIGLLGTTSVITVAELLWLRSQGPRLTERAAKIESCVSIAFMFVLTALLTLHRFSSRSLLPSLREQVWAWPLHEVLQSLIKGIFG